MKAFVLGVSLLLLILLTSCASILNGKYQKVQFDMPSEKVNMYVDGEKIVQEGDTLEIPIERDKQFHTIRIEKEGYKPQEFSVLATKKSGLVYLPFAAAAVAGGARIANEGSLLGSPIPEITLGAALIAILDRSPKSKNYADPITIEEPLIPLPSKNETSEYVTLTDIRFEKKEDEARVDRQEILAQARQLMKDYHYSDSSQTIFTEDKSGYQVSATILYTNLSNRQSLREDTPRSIEVGVIWEVTDGYGKRLLKYREFSTSTILDFPDSGSKINYRQKVSDAMEISLLKFLNREDFQRLLKSPPQEEDNSTQPILSLDVQENSIQDLSEARWATVTIDTEEGHGSGFFVSGDGFILTNLHVVANKEKVEVIDSDENRYDAELIRKDEEHDLALLRAETFPLFAFSLPQEKNYESGNSIFAIGTPSDLTLGQTLTAGIISGERQVGNSSLIQIDASVNFGSSGGPIVSKTGELLGIINSKMVGMGVEGIAFGFPAHLIGEYLHLEVLK
ncbi:MAG: trypsin-like peptidase domain-containing protein [Bacteroidota bacterium]